MSYDGLKNVGRNEKAKNGNDVGWGVDAWGGEWVHGMENGCMGWRVSAWGGEGVHGIENGCMGWIVGAWGGEWVHEVGCF